MGIADDIKTLGFNTTLVKVLFICNLGGYEILQNRFQYNSC